MAARRIILTLVALAALGAITVAAVAAEAAKPQESNATPANGGPIANPTGGSPIEVAPPTQPGDPASVPLVLLPQPQAPQVAAKTEPAKTGTEAKALGAPKPNTSPAGARTKPNETALRGTPSWTDHWLVRTTGALVLVVALLFGVRWITTRIAHGGGLAAQFGAGGRSPSGVLEVLGRYPIARGQSLVLLKMDRRILLLGQSTNGFTTLSELTDPEDIASILMKTRDDEGQSLAAQFSGLLKSAERDPGLIAEETGGPISPRLAMNAASQMTPNARPGRRLGGVVA